MSASVKVVIPKLFLIFLFSKTAIRHFVSYSFLFVFMEILLFLSFNDI